MLPARGRRVTGPRDPARAPAPLRRLEPPQGQGRVPESATRTPRCARSRRRPGCAACSAPRSARPATATRAGAPRWCATGSWNPTTPTATFVAQPRGRRGALVHPLEAAKLLTYDHDRQAGAAWCRGDPGMTRLSGAPRQGGRPPQLVAATTTQRPLSKPGRQQSDEHRRRRSPSTRSRGSCRARTSGASQTVEPLASQLGVPVDSRTRWPKARRSPSRRAARQARRASNAVLCTHGDVLGDLLDALADHGVRSTTRLEKGSIWVLDMRRRPGPQRALRSATDLTPLFPATNWRQLRLLETHE